MYHRYKIISTESYVIKYYILLLNFESKSLYVSITKQEILYFFISA